MTLTLRATRSHRLIPRTNLSCVVCSKALFRIHRCSYVSFLLQPLHHGPRGKTEPKRSAYTGPEAAGEHLIGVRLAFVDI